MERMGLYEQQNTEHLYAQQQQLVLLINDGMILIDFVVPGIKPKAFHTLGKCSPTKLHPQLFYVEIGSY